MASEIDFKSIIELCRTKFRSCVSSDRLVSALHVGQVLSAEEVLSVQDLPLEKRVDASLDLVKSKGYDGFRKLCVSLETTYPYMLNCMFLGVEPPCVTQNVRSHPEHTEKADTSTAKHKSRHFNSLPRKVVVDRRSSGTGSDSYNYNSLVEEFNNEVDEQGKAESRYLIDRSDDGGLLKRKNTKEDYDRIQTQCVGAMHEVSSLRHQHAEMVNRCELAVQEADYYRRQHQAMGDRCDHLVREGQVLRHQCEEIKSAKEKLQQDYEEIVLLREQEKSSLDMMQHGDQRSIDSVSNSSRAWDRAMSDVDSLHREKEAILEDYDDLKTNYTLLTSKLAKAQEDTSRMREKLESVVPERDALHMERNALKQQCTAAIRGYDKALRERDESLHTAVQAEQQRDLALKECDQVFALRVKFNKDVSRLQDERNAALNEYKLVMSERDSVHREIERLQDEIGELSTTNVSLKEEKDKMKQETECLHQEIVLVLADRDKARKESYDRRERLQEALKDKECVVKRLEEIQQDVEMLKQERNAARKERSEAIVHRDKILKECFQVQKMFDVYGDRHEETNSFKLQFENLSQELTKAWNEAEVAMMRRDWAFNERDKIVRELQMLRDDYDQRTKEREEMISELHFAHDELETVTKKHNKAQRELHHLRKHCNSYMTKEERLQMLSSVDSAIDTDSQDYNMETVTFEKIDTAEDLGFTIGGGSDLPLYPTDSSVFVVDVVPGSLAEGKLKVNDCLLRANSIDLSNVDFNTANKALRSRDTLTMTFLRKRPSRAKNFVQHVNMRMTLGRDLGLSIDSGLHIKKIEPGSVAADVELLSIGDKILMINQVPVDHLPYEDAKRLLKTSTLSLTIFKENASRRSSRRSLTDFLTYREKTMTVGHSERASPADDDDKPVVAHFRSPSAPVPSMSYTVKASSLNGPTHVRCSSAINPTATYNGSDTLLSSTRNERILTDEEREKILKELLTKDRHNKCIEAPATVSASTPVVSAEAKTDDTRSSSATPPPPMRSNSYMSAVLTQRPTTEHGDLHLNLESAANFYQKSKPRSGYIYNAPRSNSVGSSSMTRVALTPADSSGKVTPSSPHNMNRSDPLALSQKTSAMYADHHHRSHNSSHQSVNYVQTWGVGKRTRHPPVYNILNRPQSATPIGVEHPASPGDPIKADDSKFSRAFENVLTHIPNPYQNEKQYYGTFPGKGRRSHAGPAVDLIEHFALANPPATAKSSTIPSTKPSNFRASSSHGSLNSSVSSDRATPVSKLVYPSIQPVYEEENGELVEANYFQAQSPSQQDGVPLFETHFQPITDESQPRRVVIEKNAYPLGISIAQSAQGGVFVSAVNEGSNAERCGLQYGDQILEYNGINLRCANYAQAALILKQSSDANTVTMLVQHCIFKTSPTPDLYASGKELDGNEVLLEKQASSRLDSAVSADSELTKISNDIDMSPVPPLRFNSTSGHDAEQSSLPSLQGDGGQKSAMSREITFHNDAPFTLGIDIVGGNAVGIFVANIQPDGIIARQTEVQCGDRIIKVNEVDFSHRILEQATLDLGKSFSSLALAVEYDPIGFQKAQEGNGDSLYVRALFDHLPQGKDELSFKKGDVLHVTNTLYQGQLGVWRATLISDNEQLEKRERGLIPSRRKAEQEILLRRCSSYSEDKSKSRYGLFRRSKKGSHSYAVSHSRESSDSRGDESAPSSPGPPTGFGHVAYEYVDRLNAQFLRPVVVIGPLAQPVCDKLVMEKPYKFARCLPEMVKTTPEVIEQRMIDGVYIDYNLSRKRTSYACIKADAIEDVMQKSKHCLLDINHTAVDRLLPLQFHPIIVWIHFKSPKCLRDMKDGLYIPEKITQKDAKSLFDTFASIENEMKSHVSFSVTGSSLSNICAQISSQVDECQKRTIWVSSPL